VADAVSQFSFQYNPTVSTEHPLWENIWILVGTNYQTSRTYMIGIILNKILAQELISYMGMSICEQIAK